MSAATHRAPTSSAVAAGCGTRIAPWGQYTRYMFRSYWRNSFILLAALLSISLTTDLSALIWRLITSNPDAGFFWLSYHIARIVLLRAIDLLALGVPISCFLAVLWTEVCHTWSRERITIWNLGRSPLQCIIPVLFFGTTMGVLQFALDTSLRPAAVMALENRPDANHPDFTYSPTKQWIAVGNDLVHARISAGPPPSLGELSIYRLAADGALLATLIAEKAIPGPTLNTWRLQNVMVRNTALNVGRPPASGPAPDKAGDPDQVLDEMEFVLPIDPLWLSRHGIHPQYLPHAALRALAAPTSATHSAQRYQVWYYMRYANAFLPAGMALLAASLSLLLIPYRIRPWAIFLIAAAGYLAHIEKKTFLVLGEYGELPPAIAAWFVPILLILISAIIVIVPTMNFARVGRTTPRTEEHSDSANVGAG